MSNKNKQFIPVGFLPYRDGYHYIVKSDEEEPDYYYCLYPKHELAQISELEAQDAFVAHDYRELNYDGGFIKKEELSSVLEDMEPEEA